MLMDIGINCSPPGLSEKLVVAVRNLLFGKLAETFNTWLKVEAAHHFSIIVIVFR